MTGMGERVAGAWFPLVCDLVRLPRSSINTASTWMKQMEHIVEAAMEEKM